MSGGGGSTSPNGNGANGDHDPADDGFATFYTLYPPRVGDQRWAGARAYFTKNLQAGIPAEQMIDGAKRYAAYCEAEGITGSKYVQSAATFLGTNQGFLEAWKPSTKPKHETPGERWAREGAKDASH